MQEFIPRIIQKFVIQNLAVFPAVTILGPRQCGKSTLAKMLSSLFQKYIYLDLQNQSDLNKLTNPDLFFEANSDAVICLDEIQQLPSLFSSLRSVIDKDRRNGRFILLGSASRNLVQHSSESLAGRIGMVDLTPFTVEEVVNLEKYSLQRHWLWGGFPDSFLGFSDSHSKLWLENFIRTYVERDIPQLGIQIPSIQLRRFLTMCAHNQGQLLNASKLSESMGLTHPTIRRYIDLLEQTYILRTIPPYLINIKKRLIKSPKVYVRDSGILHQLLQINDFNSLLGNPVLGSSWEGFVIENIITSMPGWNYYFYHTSTGDEIDLLLEKGDRIIAIECKASSAPKLSKQLWNALNEVKPNETYIIAHVSDSYPIKENVTICSIQYFLSLTHD